MGPTDSESYPFLEFHHLNRINQTENFMMKFITRTFIKGLVVLLPIAAAAYVLTWLVRAGEAWIKDLILLVVPERYYFHGMGFAFMLAVIFFVGLLMYPWLTRKFLSGTDMLLRKIPIFGTIYSPVRDLMNVLGGDMQQELGQVVLITIPGTSIKALGFITREDLSRLPDSFAREDHVVVFVPWSYQLGGYSFIVRRDAVQPVDMTVEQGMRWGLTAGVSTSSPSVQRAISEEKPTKES